MRRFFRLRAEIYLILKFTLVGVKYPVFYLGFRAFRISKCRITKAIFSHPQCDFGRLSLPVEIGLGTFRVIQISCLLLGNNSPICFATTLPWASHAKSTISYR